MSEEVEEDSRWEVHSVESARGRGSLAETPTDWRVREEEEDGQRPGYKDRRDSDEQ